MSCLMSKLLDLKKIHIPKNLTTEEYHQLLEYFEFKFYANPSKIEYKYACDDIRAILDY